MGMRMIQEMMDQSGHEESFRRYLASIDCTHLLIRYELFEPYVEGKFDPEKSHQLKMRMKQTLKTLYDDRHYTVFMVVPK